MNKKIVFFLFLILFLNVLAIGEEQELVRIFLNTTVSGANIQNNVYDFPILIRLNGQNFNFDESDGSDIRFVSSNNTSLCHYIERFDVSEKVAEIFVKIPEVVANNNTQFIKMLYGEPEAPGGECASEVVFGNEYAGIWLMDTAPIHGCYNAIKDRSVNGNHGTAYYMSSSKLVDGKVGKAIRFDGYNDFIWLEMASSLNELQKNYTVSCWMKTETLCDYHKMFSASKYYEDGFGFGIKNNKLYFAAYNRQGYVFYDYSLQCNKWYHVAATMDQYNNVHFFVDGEEKGVVYGCYTPLRNTSTFFLGATTQTYTSYVEQYWKGTLDQICISSTNRSSGWLKLEYEAYRENQQFIEMETEKDEDFKVIPNISYYTLYALNSISVQDNSQIYGIIGTDFGGDIDLEFESFVKGDVYSGNDIILSEDAYIDGDATAEEDIIAQWSSVITGSFRDYSPTPQFILPEKAITASGEGYYIGPGDSLRINPDTFSILEAHDNSKVIFSAGRYDCLELNFVGNNVNFVIDIGPHETIEINVKDNIVFGSGFQMSFENTQNPLAVTIHANQTSVITFSDGSDYYGIFIAPNAKVNIGEAAKVYGSIYAKEIEIGNNATVCKPPFLTDLAHSEWAYAPPFNPHVTKYVAVVPPATDTLLITPTPYNPNISVTVNGGSPDIPVNISNDTQYISIELDDGDCGLGAVYSLKVIKSSDYVIYVNENAECEDCRGDSWDNAFSDLSRPLYIAKREGKEIWVAEGTYFHDPEPGYYAEFIIHPGTEVIGGFNGTETERKPEGSIYATILTADNDNNDPSSWPPSEEDLLNYLDDNSPTVVSFITGGKGAISSKIEGFTIQGGVAIDKIMGPGDQSVGWLSLPNNYLYAGIYYDSHYRKYDPLYKIGSGGGIYISHGSPTIKKCYIKNNYVEFDGAGIYSRSGPKLMQNCLFENNFTLQGQGCGMYNLFQKDGTIDGCVFDGNEVGKKDSIFSGTINSERSNLTIVNSIFTRNLGGVSGAAIFNRQGNLTITNCTFTGNQSTSGAGAITNYNEATATIINTILWGNSGEELQGDGFTVSYSCIEGGFPGDSNISVNPLFQEAGDPKGDDGEYGGEDDGLIIMGSSPCFDAGKDESAPEFDLRYIPRPSYAHVDIGAYEYLSIKGKFTYGKYTQSGFEVMPTMSVINNADDILDINKAIQGKMSRVLQIEAPKNKYSDERDKGYANVYTVDSNGNRLSEKYRMGFYRVYRDGEKTQFFRTKIYNGSTPNGRVVVVIKNKGVAEILKNKYHYVYVMYGEPGCHLKIEIPHDQ